MSAYDKADAVVDSGTRKVKEKTWSNEGEEEEEMILNVAVSRRWGNVPTVA